MPQEATKFGNSKGGGTAEIKMLSHRLCVHRVQTETRETKVFDSFSVRAQRVPVSSSRAGHWEAHISILIL